MNQKERIVEQAMQMFITEGIKSVRMDDIAQRLGVSKRTLYELFGDKEELLYQAMICHCETSVRHWEESTAGAENVLEALFMVLGDVMDRSETTTRVMYNMKKFYPALHDKLLSEATEMNRRCIRDMLDKGISEGLFIDTVNIDLAISVLYYTSMALVTRKEIVLPEGMNEREAFVQVLGSFFRGISTAKGLQLVDDYMKRFDPARGK